MNTPTITVPVSHLSPATLEDTPRRALEFLRGVGSSPVILRLMSEAGYTADVHEEGQRLLARVVSFVEERQAFQLVTSATHRDAMNELDTWCKTVFRRLRAATLRLFPDAAAVLFANLEISPEMDASLLAKIFLDRIEELAPSKSQKGILKLFAERCFGPEEMHHIKKLVHVSQSPAPEGETETSELNAAELAQQREARLVMLAELRAWYDDWSETARTLLVRRDHAIRVGIAHRKARAGSTPPPPVVAPVTPVAPAATDTPVAAGTEVRAA